MQANDSHLRVFSNETVSAEVTETQSFSLQQPLTLEVSTDIGDIQAASMKVSNQNGGIRLKQGLLTGSLEAVTNFGDIFLTIPAQSALDLKLETSLGRKNSLRWKIGLGQHE